MVYPPDESFARAYVSLLAIPPSGSVDAEALRAGGRRVEAWDSRSLEFTFDDLPPGRYALGAARTRYGRIVVLDEVEVRDAPVTHELVVPPLVRSDFVVLRALGPDGEPIQDLRIRSYRPMRGGTTSFSPPTIPRPDGTHWIVSDAFDAKAVLRLEISSARWGKQKAEVAPGPAAAPTVRFVRPGRLEVRITGYAGSRHVGRFRVMLQPVAGAPGGAFYRPPGRAHLSPEGEAVISPVSPGDYTLVLALAFARSRPVSSTAVSIRSGTNSLVVPLPLLHTLTVRGAMAPVTVFWAGTPSWYATENVRPDGTAVFEDLPEGEYRVASPGRTKVAVHIPGTAHVELGDE